MTAEAWLGLVGILLTFIVAPLVWMLTEFITALNRKINSVHSNHLPHIELYLKLICDKLDITYHEPKEK